MFLHVPLSTCRNDTLLTYLMIWKSTVWVRGEVRIGVKERPRQSGWRHCVIKKTQSVCKTKAVKTKRVVCADKARAHTLVGAAYFPCCSGRDCTCEPPTHLKAILVHRGLMLLTRTTVPFTHTSRPNALARSIRSAVSGS